VTRFSADVSHGFLHGLVIYGAWKVSRGGGGLWRPMTRFRNIETVMLGNLTGYQDLKLYLSGRQFFPSFNVMYAWKTTSGHAFMLNH
jgi:hypothetical protein